MKSLPVLLCGIFLVVLLASCGSSSNAFNQGGGGTETIGVTWKGVQTATPDNPDTNTAYVRKDENVAYIWSGISWDTLVDHGTDTTVIMDDLSKVSLRWFGERSTPPEEPKLHWAYYDTELNGSFIWNNSSWALLSKDMENQKKLIWKGVFTSAPENPKENWAYYNTTLTKSYRYKENDWETFEKGDVESIDSEENNGTVIRWLGSQSNAPSAPEPLWMYHNNIDTVTYIYNGHVWDTFAINSYENDCAYLDGKSILWVGADSLHTPNPQKDFVCFNFTSNNTEHWNGIRWIFLYMDNHNEYSDWKGALTEAPANPERGWCYYNTTNELSYNYLGSWVEYGSKGYEPIAKGPIVWAGEWGEELVNPQPSWIYHNTTEKVAYIYDGFRWCTFAEKTVTAKLSCLKDIQVRWLGTITTAPGTPQVDDGFHESTNRGCYIWNGDEWAILYIPDQGTSLLWAGNFTEAPADVPENTGYYNTTDKRSYKLAGSTWYPITREDIIRK